MSSKGQKSKQSQLSNLDGSARLKRLDMVFSKALDVAMNSIGEGELDECFGDMKGTLGNNIQKAFVNMIAESQANMEAEYKAICLRRDLDDKLKMLETLPPTVDSNAVTSNPFELLLVDLKGTETENLILSIGALEKEVGQMTERAVRLRASLQNEVSSLQEETNKIVLAANQGGKA